MSIGDILVKLGQQKTLSQSELADLHQWGELTQSNNQIIPGWIKPGSTQPNPDTIKARLGIFDIIQIWNKSVQTGEIDGDLFLGEDLTDPAKAGFHFFATDQTYNSESVGAGDLLLGDNSSGQPNILWDNSAAEFLVRTGTITTGKLVGDSFLSGLNARIKRQLSNLTVSNNTYTDCVFNTEEFDNGNYYDSAVSTTDITIPEDGNYLIIITATWNTNGTGARWAYATRDTGSGAVIMYPYEYDDNPSSSSPSFQSGSDIRALTKNDVVTLRLRQSSGGNLDLVYGALTIERRS